MRSEACDLGGTDQRWARPPSWNFGAFVVGSAEALAVYTPSPEPTGASQHRRIKREAGRCATARRYATSDWACDRGGPRESADRQHLPGEVVQWEEIFAAAYTEE